jgi:hypothetical protein
MKRLAIALILQIAVIQLFAQEKSKEIDLPSFNIINNADYTITATVTGLNNFKYTLHNQKATKEASFILYPNDLTTFKKEFYKAFLEICSKSDSAIYKKGDQTIPADLVSEADKLYYMFTVNYSTKFDSDEQPVAGRLCYNSGDIYIQKTAYVKNYMKEKVNTGIRDYKENHSCRNKKFVDEECKDCDPKDQILCLKKCGANLFRLDHNREWLCKGDFKKEYEEDLINKENQQLINAVKECESSYSQILELIKNKTKRIEDIKLISNDLSKSLITFDHIIDSINSELTNRKAALLTIVNHWNDPADSNKRISFIGEESDTLILERFIDPTRQKSQILKVEQELDSIQKIISDTATILRNLSLQIKEDQLLEDSISVDKFIKYKEILLDNVINLTRKVESLNITIDEKNNDLNQGKELIRNLSEIKKYKKDKESEKVSITNKLENNNQLMLVEIAKLDTLQNDATRNKRALISAVKAINSYKFKVIDIEVEFNEGYIENIRVIGDANLPGTYQLDESILKEMALDSLKFSNAFPIGFTSKNDFDYLRAMNLYARDNLKDSYIMRFADLFKGYYQEHEVNRRDYGPADDVLNFNENLGYCRELKKDETYKLLDAKVYSDFVGFEANSPNGLVQTEVSREFRLYTKRFRFSSRFKLLDAWNFGFLSYTEPKIVISKIENNNKSLKLDTGPGNGLANTNGYASSVDLRSHETFSFSPVELNFVFIDIPGGKSTVYLNGGMRFGRTSISDSIITTVDTGEIVTTEQTYGINTFSLYPKLIWEVKTDERLGLNLAYYPEYFDALTTDLIQVNDYDNYEKKYIRDKFLNNLEFNASLNPTKSNNGRIFFRYRYTWQWGSNMNNGYHQAQVGYSFYIIGRSSGKE